ncbi:MAG: DUF1223 domain-containing protein [Burkholderiaceae bacterium]
MRPRHLAALTTLALACGAAGAAGGAACEARSGAVAPTIVELYTSEGCSSCPPADRWLSTLKGSAEVLPLAFHVTYWDRLGWPDRFATPEATARQNELARLAGSSQVYTPQVVVGGRDWRNWPQLPQRNTAAAPVQAVLTRDGERVTAQVAASSSGPTRLSGYWAVLENGHQSKVKAGENAGETLNHDHVVRLYKPVPGWAAPDGYSATLSVSRGAPEFPRRVVFVITDAATQRPMQALALGC